MNNSIQAIILAAGKSTRFNTEKTKLVEPICGRPMILFPIKLLQTLHIPTIVVVGYQQEMVKNIINAEHDSIEFMIQEKQNGTGHALACTQTLWRNDHILVMNGDMPLVTQEAIITLYAQHKEQNATISFVTSCNPNTTGKAYGRVIKTDDYISIVEAKDFTGDTTQQY